MPESAPAPENAPFHRYWRDWTTAELAAVDCRRLIAVLPVAAIEQHGPHLPLSTDATLNRAILDAAIAAMPADLPAVVLPAQEIGFSPEHVSFPGTLTLQVSTTVQLWTDIGDSLARAGLRKLLIFNSHGGQPQIMNLVAQDLRVRHGMLAAHVSWFDFGLPDGLFGQDELTHGIHGGAIETSMMLHAAPGAVRLDRAADFPSEASRMAGGNRWLRPLGPAAFGWLTEDLNPDGVVGDATAGEAEKGRRVIEHAASSLVETLQELDRAVPPA